MSDQEINIAIAEACGWKFEQTEEGGKITYPCGFASEFSPISWAKEKFLKTIPDYCGDLNAMHEAEQKLTEDQREQYLNILYEVCNPHSMLNDEWNLNCATASQRAEAFLRTIGKWKEAAK